MTLMISGGGGGGGATSLSGLSDVTLGLLANGQILQYNSGSGQWENTALTGQLTYKGSFDASTGTPALTNALKGDFYVISVAGTQFGQSWSIGDHLIVNDDMGGVIDNSKIDKIDNTETGLQAVVDDTTPQLGGALDVNGNAIVSAGAGNIAITPDTTGSIVLDGLNWPQADGAANQVLVTNGAGQLSFTDQTGLTDVVDDTTPQLGGALDVNGNAIVSAAAGNIAITPDTTGSIVLDGLNWPQADGAANQVLKTDGAGQLSFVDQSGGGSRPNVYTQSASFTIGDGTDTDPGAVTAAELERIYIINNGASAVTVTLPLIAGNVGAGYKLQIKRLGSAVVTVGRNGNNIDGLATDASLSVQYSSLTICCAGGSDWYII